MNKSDIKNRLQEIDKEKKELENRLAEETGTYEDIWDYLTTKYPTTLYENAANMVVICNEFKLQLSWFTLARKDGKLIVGELETLIAEYMGANKFIERLINCEGGGLDSENWLDLILDGKDIMVVMNKPVLYLEKHANYIFQDVMKKYPMADLDTATWCIAEYIGQ